MHLLIGHGDRHGELFMGSVNPLLPKCKAICFLPLVIKASSETQGLINLDCYLKKLSVCQLLACLSCAIFKTPVGSWFWGQLIDAYRIFSILNDHRIKARDLGRNQPDLPRYPQHPNLSPPFPWSGWQFYHQKPTQSPYSVRSPPIFPVSWPLYIYIIRFFF